MGGAQHLAFSHRSRKKKFDARIFKAATEGSARATAHQRVLGPVCEAGPRAHARKFGHQLIKGGGIELQAHPVAMNVFVYVLDVFDERLTPLSGTSYCYCLFFGRAKKNRDPPKKNGGARFASGPLVAHPRVADHA
jgi:hypothetical protein